MGNKDSGDIKISDFDLSRLLDVDSELLTTMCGTPLFLAQKYYHHVNLTVMDLSLIIGVCL